MLDFTGGERLPRDRHAQALVLCRGLLGPALQRGGFPQLDETVQRLGARRGAQWRAVACPSEARCATRLLLLVLLLLVLLLVRLPLLLRRVLGVSMKLCCCAAAVAAVDG
jgi:hypothetical protein